MLEVGERTDQVFWQPWIAGFARAMRLRPGAWARIETSNELDVIEAVQAGQTLYAAANSTSAPAGERRDVLDSLVPMLIGGIMRDLNASTRRQGEGVGERAKDWYV